MAKAIKGGLGRGLDALFSDTEISTDGKEQASLEGIANISLDHIKPNTNQPRKTFNEEKINELADSIKEHGVIQPIIVNKLKDSGYEIVAGERRWRAARAAGLKEVPCVVRELSDEEHMLFAIIENMQREDLNPIEEAEGLASMIETYGFTQSEVSKSVGKSRPYITNSLRLLKLPKEIQDMMGEGNLSAGHARALVAIEDKELQIKLAKMAIDQGLSVRAIEELSNGEKQAKRRGKPAKRSPKSSEVLLIERELKSNLGTKVNINGKGKKGKIEIEYYSEDELERLIDLLKTV
ncbi:MAG: ParB/RepB/Spo0J family partition protein [Anaerovoracaceae bacterium]